MGERPCLDVEYVLDRCASSDEVNAVAQIVLEEGVPGRVRAALAQKGIENLPWVILILVPVTPFIKGFFEEAGRSSYKDLRELVSRLLAVRRKGQGYVEIRDKDSLTTVVFPRDLPEEAFKQLANLGSENIDGKYWVWDPEQNCWESQSVDGE